jgi:methylated-DNA-[protein]-cysteine S-methyltransferase
MTATAQRLIDSPLGPITLIASDTAVLGVYFAEHKRRPATGDLPQPANHPALDAAEAAFAEYFAGTANGVELPPVTTGTAFQREVWAQLREIPPGTTWTYAQVAANIGKPSAVRAVASAIGANPLSIAVPCHRVVGSDGSITGYAGGVARKQWLLNHEQK